jgi:hypothetical protein
MMGFNWYEQAWASKGTVPIGRDDRIIRDALRARRMVVNDEPTRSTHSCIQTMHTFYRRDIEGSMSRPLKIVHNLFLKYFANLRPALSSRIVVPIFVPTEKASTHRSVISIAPDVSYKTNPFPNLYFRGRDHRNPQNAEQL